MPRLTNAEYLKRHKFVQILYESEPHAQAILGFLELDKQQVLHYYYATAETAKTDNELIEHRKWCDQNTTLRAGKAFSQIFKITVHLMKATGVECNFSDTAAVAKKITELNKRIGETKIRNQNRANHYKSKAQVVPVMRSKIDIEKLSSALALIARRMAYDPEYKAKVEEIVKPSRKEY